MFHGCQPRTDFIDQQSGLYGGIGGGERFQFSLRNIPVRESQDRAATGDLVDE